MSILEAVALLLASAPSCSRALDRPIQSANSPLDVSLLANPGGARMSSDLLGSWGYRGQASPSTGLRVLLYVSLAGSPCDRPPSPLARPSCALRVEQLFETMARSS